MAAATYTLGKLGIYDMVMKKCYIHAFCLSVMHVQSAQRGWGAVVEWSYKLQGKLGICELMGRQALRWASAMRCAERSDGCCGMALQGELGTCDRMGTTDTAVAGFAGTWTETQGKLGSYPRVEDCSGLWWPFWCSTCFALKSTSVVCGGAVWYPGMGEIGSVLRFAVVLVLLCLW